MYRIIFLSLVLTTFVSPAFALEYSSTTTQKQEPTRGNTAKTTDTGSDETTEEEIAEVVELDELDPDEIEEIVELEPEPTTRPQAASSTPPKRRSDQQQTAVTQVEQPEAEPEPIFMDYLTGFFIGLDLGVSYRILMSDDLSKYCPNVYADSECDYFKSHPAGIGAGVNVGYRFTPFLSIFAEGMGAEGGSFKKLKTNKEASAIITDFAFYGVARFYPLLINPHPATYQLKGLFIEGGLGYASTYFKSADKSFELNFTKGRLTELVGAGYEYPLHDHLTIQIRVTGRHTHNDYPVFYIDGRFGATYTF